MAYNLNAGYGRLDADRIWTTGGTTGKTFVVAASTTPNYASLAEIFTPDTEGVPRLYSTITSALAQCVANRNDIIYVAPWYTETITGAAGIALNVAWVSIIGIGSGSLRPTISFTTAITAQMTWTAANVTVQNMVFIAGFDAITAMISITGAYPRLLDCDIQTNTGTVGAVLGILTAATATWLRIERCRFMWTATNSWTTTTAQVQHEVGIDYVIQNNYFTGKMTQAILNTTTLLGGLIDNNRFVVATGTKAITMAAASTPFISNNRINVPSGTTPIVAAAGFVAGNVYSAAAGVSAGTASTI
jgi:hypothetical protein